MGTPETRLERVERTAVDVPSERQACRVGTFVLVTAAYNEEHNIAETLSAVASQSVLPASWVVVSDGSTDRTDEIVQEWSRRERWLHGSDG